MSKNPNYAEKLEQLQDLEGSTHSQHLLVEVVIMCILCVVGWVLLGFWQLVVWFCITYFLMFLDRWLLFRGNETTAKRQYYQHLFLSFVTATVASFLPVFLWLQDGKLYHFAALTYVTCAILNTFLVRTMSWPLTLCFLVPNATVLLVISSSFFWSGASLVEAALAMLIATFAISYVSSSLIESLRQHREHHETQKRLNVSQKFETLGTLSAGIAHDFNNLLGVISGNLELLSDEAKTTKERELIARGLSATDRAASVTDLLLHYGAVSQLSETAVDIDSLMEEIRLVVSKDLPEQINLSFFVYDDADAVLADKSVLRSALLGLIVNARDAIDKAGSIEITVSNWAKNAPFEGYLLTRPTAESYVEISIADSGRGIELDDPNKVFDPYFSSQQSGDGAGLGLAMVLGFVKQSRGDIRITSDISNGTTVQILLPSIKEANSSNIAEQSNPRYIAPKHETGSKGQKHLLIVEDEAQLLHVLSEKLENDGYLVSTSQTGDGALEVFSAEAGIDLILTDVLMPGTIQGVALVEKVAEMSSSTKFVIISGYSPEQISIPETLQGRAIFLKKPVSLSVVSQSVSSLLRDTPN